MAVKALATGDRFIAIEREAIVWVVDACFDSPGGIRHARLRQIDAPHIQRTFSEVALHDRRMFRPVLI
jgi:hypothetical protein